MLGEAPPLLWDNLRGKLRRWTIIPAIVANFEAVTAIPLLCLPPPILASQYNQLAFLLFSMTVSRDGPDTRMIIEVNMTFPGSVSAFIHCTTKIRKIVINSNSSGSSSGCQSLSWPCFAQQQLIVKVSYSYYYIDNCWFISLGVR